MNKNFLKEWKDNIFGKNNEDIIVGKREGLDRLFVFKNTSELPNPESELYYQGCQCYVQNEKSFYEMRNNKWHKIVHQDIS